MTVRARVDPKADRCGPTGKRRFRSAAAAGIALETARTHAADPTDARAERRRERRIYHCRQCDGWHLSSQVE